MTIKSAAVSIIMETLVKGVPMSTTIKIQVEKSKKRH